MSASKSVATNQGQTIEVLQSRYNKLNTQKIEAGANLKNAQKELERLKQEAREKYGTDDLTELRNKLEAMKEENERKRASYQADLDRIEKDLDSVEQKFSATQSATLV